MQFIFKTIKLLQFLAVRIRLPTIPMASRYRVKSYSLAALVLLVLLIPVIYFTLKHARSASAGWFDDAWLYRKPIAITNAGSAQTDFQVKVLADVDMSSDVTNGKVQADFDDLRFTDINGKLLNYWIEDDTSSSLDVWAKLPSIPTSGATVYMYYGNPSASSYQNGNNTFEFFDDFDTDSSTNYTITKQVVRGSGTGFIWDTTNSQLKSDTSNDCLTIHTSTSLSNLYVWSSAVYTGDNDGYGVFIKSSSTYYEAIVSSDHPTATDGIFTRTSGEPILAQATTNSFDSQTTTHEIGIGYNGSQFKMYVDGNLEASYNASITPNGFGLTSEANSPAATYSNLIARKYTTNEPSAGAPGGEEESEGPVGYWKFDEGYGDTANDSTQNNNDGTFGTSPADPTWQSEDMCISGKCLKFDGSDDIINFGTNNSLKVNDALTISLWVKRPDKTTFERFLSHSTDADNYAYELGVDFTDPDYWRFRLNNDAVTLKVQMRSNANEWVHLAVTYDKDSGGSDEMKMYENGILVGTQDYSTVLSNHGSLKTNRQGKSDGFLKSLTDEVKIYPYARSAAQIKTDYASQGSAHGVGVVLGTSKDQGDFLSEGLVGYWKMDEASSPSVDSSGNGNSGTWNGTADDATGKFGNAITLDGDSDYINVGSDSSLDQTTSVTIAAWVNPDTNAGWDVIYQRVDGTPNGYRMKISDTSKWAFNPDASGDWLYSSDDASTDTWSHVVGTWDGSTSTLYVNGVEINSQVDTGTPTSTTGETANIGSYGNGVSQFFDGEIDDVRIYNRALSPKEVRDLYNWAPGPYVYLNFDEGTGSTINDQSGNEYSGTWNGSGTHWTQGKFGGGAKFDGSSDYVSFSSLPKPTNLPVTIEFWTKPTTSTPVGIFDSAPSSQDVFRNYSSGNVEWWSSDPMVSLGLTANQWTHLAFTFSYSGGTQYIEWYKDGVKQTTGSDSGDGTWAWTTFRLGNINGGSAGWYSGVLDEFKIYNYARTGKQIVEDMNAGHPAVGSPVGSAVAHYKFDEGYGDTANNSGNGGSSLNGDLAGACPGAATCPTWTNAGKIGKALDFDGGDYVSMGDQSMLEPTKLTVSAWVKTDTVSSRQQIAGKFGNAAGGNCAYGYNIEITASGKAGLTLDPVDCGNSYTLSSNTSLS